MTFSKFLRSETKVSPLEAGSSGKTSNAAPRICSPSRADTRSGMLTTDPLDALIRHDPFLIRPISLLLIMFRVTGVSGTCLLYTSDAADDLLCVDLGGRRIIKK